MIENDITRALAEMRETLVTRRRTATAKRDIVDLLEAQAGIDVLDRALAEEHALATDAVAEEITRRAREAPGRQAFKDDPFGDADTAVDPMTL